MRGIGVGTPQVSFSGKEEETVSIEEYKAYHRRSIEDRDGFWAEQAGRIHWNKDFEQVCDFGRPPFVRWFAGGRRTSATTRSTATSTSGATRRP